MIYVTQGHENGIGLEVFLKSFILLPAFHQKKFILICAKKSLIQTLDLIKIPYSISSSAVSILGKKLICSFTNGTGPESTLAMLEATKLITSNDILVTLPTSKDQLFIGTKKLNGHTEWLREFYKTEVSMFFKSLDANVLLITDHIALNQVGTVITTKLIEDKIKIALEGCKKYFSPIDEVLVSGINPHCGENGLLGHEELNLKDCKYKFLPGDSLLVNNDFKMNRLFVYMYHDQGLAPFKTLFKTIGANISFGLPYLRLSVDHGTAFDLYGKNQSDYMGCFYVLKLALASSENL